MKLEPQIFGYKGKRCVFCRAYLIPGVAHQRTAILISCIVGKGSVEEDTTTVGVVIRAGFRGRDIAFSLCEVAVSNLGLAVLGGLPSMKPVDDGLTDAVGLGRGSSLRGPSYPLRRLRPLGGHDG